ncbi:MAG: glycoside hydrolase family 16 protein [Clostridia bacterium]
MKKLLSKIATIAIFGVASLSLVGCEYHTDNSDKWKTKFDITMPNFDKSGDSVESANEQGWYSTMQENFDGNKLSDKWSPSLHGLRQKEYWCADQVSMADGLVKITAEKDANHNCSSSICPKEGLFTSGIETRITVDGKSISLFEQAFGYFEAKVKLPKSGGMQSAFWLQTESMRTVGNQGMDGSEIDIYESSFIKNPTKVGHCIHIDGYDEGHRGGQATRDTGKDLYEGYHTYALKWTPQEYVFYVDGVATWATDFGGICRVPTFLRLTSAVRPNGIGAHGQKLGAFTGGEFMIDSVKVYQNKNFLSEIKSPSDFK